MHNEASWPRLWFDLWNFPSFPCFLSEEKGPAKSVITKNKDGGPVLTTKFKEKLKKQHTTFNLTVSCINSLD